MVAEGTLMFQYDGTKQSFITSLNDFNNSWRLKLIKELQTIGTDYPDPVFTEKGRKILSAPIKVQCEDGVIDNELCIRRIIFEDKSIGYYDMFLV